MSAAVVLDSTPLGILCHRRSPPHVAACRQWIADLLIAGRRVINSEIADYEIRRELIRRNGIIALANLDAYGIHLEYLPITTAAMSTAAELWAQIRNIGKPTAPDHALDGDVILAAQTLSLGVPAIVASANPAQLARFVPTDDWRNIAP